MKADKRNSIGRYRILLIVMAIIGVYVFGKAIRTMISPQKDYWIAVDKRFTKENIPIPANRGNLLDCNGRILSGSVPEYRLYMDFRVIDPDSAHKAKTEAFRDSVFNHCLDSIALGLESIFPDKSAAWFRKRLLDGKKRGGFSYRIYPKHATYIQYKQCKELPLLRESAMKGGFHGEEIMQRKKPYGILASRTLGDLYKDSNAAKFGLELSFDSILRGEPGLSHRSTIRNRRLSFIDKEPSDGHDLMTTIDIDIQDFADRSLRNKLHELEGEIGIAIVMEVKTGDVKAIVNLTRGNDGEYYEMKNNAVSDLMEPGSTFKTASIMVAMEDGHINKNTRIDTGNGIYLMYKREMKDHNWRKGGYNELTVTQVLEYSSNIGVSRLIDQAYHDDPDKFVRGLNKIGVGIPLNLPFAGKGEPIVRHPEKQGRYWKNWSNTALPWMSIGYETMIPPISTLTFYNAIANGGKMVKPRFVKAELENGQVVREFPTETIKESICKPSTLEQIQEILEKVVSEGHGKKAGNGGKYFLVSGKTGTAQVAGKGGYHNGPKKYMVSFCGYFPSDAPQYSCIVCIVKYNTPASGGGQCGPVFRDISQYIMSKGEFREASEAKDTNYVHHPMVAKGRNDKTKVILDALDLEDSTSGDTSDSIPVNRVPDLRGMGARDAVYIMQERGLKVKLKGKGHVKAQNMPPGTIIETGKCITLTLE